MRKISKKKNACPKCECAKSMVSSIVRGFKKCVECRYVIGTRKVKRLQTKRFGLGQKTLDEAIKKLQDFKTGIPKEATAARLQLEGYTGSYRLVVEREEADDEIYARLLKAEEKEIVILEKKKKAEDKLVELKKKRAAKLVLSQKNKQKTDALKASKVQKRKEKFAKEKKNLEVFLQANGLSVEALKELIRP